MQTPVFEVVGSLPTREEVCETVEQEMKKDAEQGKIDAVYDVVNDIWERDVIPTDTERLENSSSSSQLLSVTKKTLSRLLFNRLLASISEKQRIIDISDYVSIEMSNSSYRLIFTACSFFVIFVKLYNDATLFSHDITIKTGYY